MKEELGDEFFVLRPFCPPGPRSLDCFKELEPAIGEGTFCVNVPNVCIAKCNARGISGPSSGSELFIPARLEGELSLGSYDRWRPYPADNLTTYVVKMARKMTNKRLRAFKKIASEKPWYSLVYVDHSAASLCHLDRKEAAGLARRVFDVLEQVSCELPSMSYVFFSPYGLAEEPGFVLTNMSDESKFEKWEDIRRFLGARL